MNAIPEGLGPTPARPRTARRGAWFLVLASVLAGAELHASGDSPDAFADLVGDGAVNELSLRDEALSREIGRTIRYGIRLTTWTPRRPNGTTIIYTHGLQDHRGWFNATAQRLADAGFAVIAYDRIGSGESSDGASLVGGRLATARGHIRAWGLFVDVLAVVVDHARASHPDNRIVLWANDYGAKIVEAYLLDRAATLAASRVAAAVFVTAALRYNGRTMPVPYTTLDLVLSSSLRRFPVPMVARGGDNGARWFAPPGEWFERIRQDGRSLRDVTRAFLLETTKLDQFVRSARPGRHQPVPTFYLLVNGDEVVDDDAVIEHLRWRASDARVKFYQGGPEHRHHLLFTADHDRAMADIELFLSGRGAAIEGAIRFMAPPRR